MSVPCLAMKLVFKVDGASVRKLMNPDSTSLSSAVCTQAPSLISNLMFFAIPIIEEPIWVLYLHTSQSIER